MLHNNIIRDYKYLDFYLEELFRVSQLSESNVFAKQKIQEMFLSHQNSCMHLDCSCHDIDFQKSRKCVTFDEILKLIDSILSRSLKSNVLIKDAKRHEHLSLKYISFVAKYLNNSTVSYYRLKKILFQDKNKSFYFKSISQILARRIQSMMDECIRDILKADECNKLNVRAALQIITTQDEARNSCIPLLQGYVQDKINFWEAMKNRSLTLDQLSVNLQKLSQKNLNIIGQFSGFLKMHDISLQSQNVVILKIASIYKAIVQNQMKVSQSLDNNVEDMIKRQMNKNEDRITNIDLMQGKLVLIQVSMAKNPGLILNKNKKQILRFFGYDQNEEQLIRDVNQLMPTLFGNVHNGLMNNYVVKGYSNLFNGSHFTFSKTKKGFLYPIKLQIDQLFSFKDDFVLNGSVLKHPTTNHYILINESGVIEGLTENLYLLLLSENLEYGSIAERLNIQLLIPNFYDILIKYNLKHKDSIKDINDKFNKQESFNMDYQITSETITIYIPKLIDQLSKQFFEICSNYFLKQKNDVLYKNQSFTHSEDNEDENIFEKLFQRFYSDNILVKLHFFKQNIILQIFDLLYQIKIFIKKQKKKWREQSSKIYQITISVQQKYLSVLNEQMKNLKVNKSYYCIKITDIIFVDTQSQREITMQKMPKFDSSRLIKIPQNLMIQNYDEVKQPQPEPQLIQVNNIKSNQNLSTLKEYHPDEEDEDEQQNLESDNHSLNYYSQPKSSEDMKSQFSNIQQQNLHVQFEDNLQIEDQNFSSRNERDIIQVFDMSELQKDYILADTKQQNQFNLFLTPRYQSNANLIQSPDSNRDSESHTFNNPQLQTLKQSIINKSQFKKSLFKSSKIKDNSNNMEQILQEQQIQHKQSNENKTMQNQNNLTSQNESNDNQNRVHQVAQKQQNNYASSVNSSQRAGTDNQIIHKIASGQKQTILDFPNQIINCRFLFFSCLVVAASTVILAQIKPINDQIDQPFRIGILMEIFSKQILNTQKLYQLDQKILSDSLQQQYSTQLAQTIQESSESFLNEFRSHFDITYEFGDKYLDKVIPITIYSSKQNMVVGLKLIEFLFQMMNSVWVITQKNIEEQMNNFYFMNYNFKEFGKLLLSLNDQSFLEITDMKESLKQYYMIFLIIIVSTLSVIVLFVIYFISKLSNYKEKILLLVARLTIKDIDKEIYILNQCYKYLQDQGHVWQQINFSDYIQHTELPLDFYIQKEQKTQNMLSQNFQFSHYNFTNQIQSGQDLQSRNKIATASSERTASQTVKKISINNSKPKDISYISSFLQGQKLNQIKFNIIFICSIVICGIFYLVFLSMGFLISQHLDPYINILESTSKLYLNINQALITSEIIIAAPLIQLQNPNYPVFQSEEFIEILLSSVKQIEDFKEEYIQHLKELNGNVSAKLVQIETLFTMDVCQEFKDEDICKEENTNENSIYLRDILKNGISSLITNYLVHFKNLIYILQQNEDKLKQMQLISDFLNNETNFYLIFESYNLPIKSINLIFENITILSKEIIDELFDVTLIYFTIIGSTLIVLQIILDFIIKANMKKSIQQYHIGLTFIPVQIAVQETTSQIIKSFYKI